MLVAGTKLWVITINLLYCVSVGFNVETIQYKGVAFTTWDVSGRSGIVSYKLNNGLNAGARVIIIPYLAIIDIFIPPCSVPCGDTTIRTLMLWYLWLTVMIVSDCQSARMSYGGSCRRMSSRTAFFWSWPTSKTYPTPWLQRRSQTNCSSTQSQTENGVSIKNTALFDIEAGK